MQRPTTLRSHTIAHREVIKKSKSKPKSHARSVSEVPDNVSNRIGDNITRKTVEHGTHPENENEQQSTNRELSDNIQRSSTTADSHANTKHATQQTDVMPDATKEDSQAKNEEADLLSEKKALETRRIQLKQEVARLEQQLQKELELRKKLETGIKISQQALFSQFSTNEKV
ncbi:hypothetical protein HanOQP8_Chr02g0070931 [Helianthus annuus]|nr:hypothetical protein HanOQP8_Chr02g0070931 [Helianthus annuus]